MVMERGGPAGSGPGAGPTARPVALRARGCCRAPKFEHAAATLPAGGEPEVAGTTGSGPNGAGAGAGSPEHPLRRESFDAFAKTSPSVSRGELLAAGSGPRQGFGARRRSAAGADFAAALIPSGPATQQARLTLADEKKPSPCCSETAPKPSASWAAPGAASGEQPATAAQSSSGASGTTTGRQAGASVSRRARGRPPSAGGTLACPYPPLGVL
jgi:hypothetical protein